MGIIFVVAVSAAIRQETVDAGPDIDAARSRMCAAPSTNTIAGDILSGNFRYQSFVKKETDDKEKYAAFLKHALPMLQIHHDSVEPDFYVTFSVYFNYGPGRAKQLAAAIVCKEQIGSTNNACRNRTYLFYSNNEPEILAELIVDDILKSEPIRKCPNA